tara:strand:+ start:171 stop:1793 length:1623 start_codon:yes stop_codon:yes gene_type:complete
MLKKSLAWTFTILLALTAAGLLYARQLYARQLSQQLFPPQAAVALDSAPRCAGAALRAPTNVRISGVSRHRFPAAHCKVAGVIEDEINFELLLPEDWNGKYVMGGGGGFVGSVVNTAVYFGALQSGYATSGTDTGHRGHGVDASWALDNPRRVENFGHRAVHLTAVASKALVDSYYGQPSRRNYFIGCSRGGGQALMEAQRYPRDFDGIVAGAPAYNWHLGIGANATQIVQAQFPDPDDLEQALVTPADQALIARSYLARCDAADGIEDGILAHPPDCDFDVAELACSADRQDDCLSAAKVQAMRRIYEGPEIDGENVWPGFPLGGETSPAGMSMWLTGGLRYAREAGYPRADAGFAAPLVPNASYAFGTGVMKYFVFNDAQWDYASYDFTGFTADTAATARTLNATDPDLSAFRARGGKLLLFHGWSDMALSAHGTIDYYRAALAHDPGAEADLRLYLLPGMDHCFGGAGPFYVNYLTEIDRWVESGQAPGPLQAHWMKAFVLPSGSRLACPYPQRARYDGSGDTRDAASFRCHTPALH